MLNQDPLWYKDAVFYELHVRAFTTATTTVRSEIFRPDPEAGLSPNGSVWIACGYCPFYPSPLRDDGYDVADFRNIAASCRHDWMDFRRAGGGAPPQHAGDRGPDSSITPPTNMPGFRQPKLPGCPDPPLLRLERRIRNPRAGYFFVDTENPSGPGTMRHRRVLAPFSATSRT